MKSILSFFIAILLFACNNESKKETSEQQSNIKTMGTVERIDAALDNIISADAKPEVIADGFEWSEGPLWIESHQMLLFSDVPTNTIYKWTEAKGKEVYLKPSGFTGTDSKSKEPGSNGLILDNSGNLVLCQHGDRRMARMDAGFDKPEAKYITIADKFNGKRFSSPNDAVYNSFGDLFFTDPPYGLPSQDDSDPAKETTSNGVYKVKKNGEVILQADSITRPNGIALFPGEKRLLVACSDPDKPNWYEFIVAGDTLINGKIFYSTEGQNHGVGSPDGLKIDKNGNVFATGPGGIWIFNSEAKVLGKIKLDEPSSNVALSPDEKTLYITNDMYVLRVKMRE
ncbi:MAG TPA: SMP-30/gluconolactonase/LRE family protein [Chitinophagaceae bacterium]|nr:SMP-30/gluconolactonase/LRE family protein [Chitinophagaceae bacterium]